LEKIPSLGSEVRKGREKAGRYPEPLGATLRRE
jgi:hypothetical protein